MPYQFHRLVVTCGVSIFAEGNAGRPWAAGIGAVQFPKPGPNPEPAEGLDERDAHELLARACARGPSGPPDVRDPKRVSAEYSVLNALEAQGRLGPNPFILLIHTKSFAGEAAALVLSKVIERDFGARTEREGVTIRVEDREGLRHDLGAFMHKVAAGLRGHDPESACFAPLGGYKIMTSLGYLAGAYFGFPTLYAHEDGQVLHTLPAIPVRVDRDALARVAPLMRKVQGLFDREQLGAKERKLADEFPWLFERDGAEIGVNAFGIFLMSEPEHADLFSVPVLVTQEIARRYAKDPRRGFVDQQLRSLAGKLAAGSTEPDLRHERDWGLSDPQRHVYKGASNGVHVMRCVYAYDGQALRVHHVWTDHDAYERELEARWQDRREAETPWE
jgi:putative CRISPR-associated protein (TIGR02619 family)